MQSILGKIQPMVQEVAMAISLALEIEVEVADDQLIRVAGTGELGQYIGSQMPDSGHLFEMVLNSGRVCVIESPGGHPYCWPCRRRGRCYATAEICCPILCGGSTVGVIGLTARDEVQKQRLLTNAKYKVAFLTQMARLIGIKAQEALLQEKVECLSELFRRVINYVDQGVIVIDKEGVISGINAYALGILGLRLEGVQGKRVTEVIKSEVLNHFLLTGREFRDKRTTLESGNRTVEVLCNVYAVRDGEKLLGAAVIFRDSKDLAMCLNDKPYTFEDFIGVSEEVRKVKEKALLVAASDSTVLIRGESGTGKEILARAIHRASRRSRFPFVAINCGAIPENLLESELFGYEEGAFTGARKGGRIGRLELANGGTVFLDEVGDMPLHLQVKLLRVLQEKRIERIGGKGTVPIDVRIIAATNRDLEAMAERGEFRWDLYYRLNVIPLEIPPLRERPEDILVLAEYYLNNFSNQLGKKIRGFSPEVKELLVQYPWPGNVRELSNAIEYAVNMEMGEEITTLSLPDRVITKSTSQGRGTPAVLESERILEALKRFGTTTEGKRLAAKFLGISLATLYRRMKSLGLTRT